MAKDWAKGMDQVVVMASRDMEEAMNSFKSVAWDLWAVWSEPDFDSTRMRAKIRELATIARKLEDLGDAMVQIDEEAAGGPGT